jgi:WD40 repeat protein
MAIQQQVGLVGGDHSRQQLQREQLHGNHWQQLCKLNMDCLRAKGSSRLLYGTAGDSTVKLWGFEKQKCVATLSDHKQAVWAVKYHHAGDWLASCSLDHSVR